MKADEAWRLGERHFNWCGHCKKKPGADKDSNECGHMGPVLAAVNGESGLVRCYCIKPDIAKLNENLKPQGRQEDLF